MCPCWSGYLGKGAGSVTVLDGINRTDTLGRIIRKTMVTGENQWVRSVVFCSGEVNVAIREQKNSHIPYWGSIQEQSQMINILP